MTDEGYRLFYRIAVTNPTTLYDYSSAKERGIREPQSPTRRAVWDGLSVFSTLNQARRKQRISPFLGTYIAVIRVPMDGSIRVLRTSVATVTIRSGLPRRCCGTWRCR